jgi:MFS family permease
MHTDQGAGRHDPYSALRNRDYRFFLSGNLLANLGMRMQAVAVLWEVYERTQSAMALAWVGLVQVLPVIALALPAGQVADRFNRKRIVMLAQAVIALGSVGLALNSRSYGSVNAIYGFLLLTALARAFQQPARASLMPQIVPREQFGNAVMWNTGGFQLASVLGPALGGFMIALFRSPASVYLVDAAAALSFFAALAMVQGGGIVAKGAALGMRSLLAGVEFVWGRKLILGAITLDMFAVLLGGATSLLPIFAKDVLHVGPRGMGAMLAAPFVGALAMSFVLAHRKPLERSGRALLWSVVGFGVATIVFGFSRSFVLSMVMLALTGGFDAISVVVRHTIVQMLTPDDMRGRVSAINGLFISISNEMGGFESGLVAALFGGGAYGATVSTVSGGVGTLVVVALTALLWPAMRRYGRLGSIPEGYETVVERGFPVIAEPAEPVDAAAEVIRSMEEPEE